VDHTQHLWHAELEGPVGAGDTGDELVGAPEIFDAVGVKVDHDEDVIGGAEGVALDQAGDRRGVGGGKVVERPPGRPGTAKLSKRLEVAKAAAPRHAGKDDFVVEIAQAHASGYQLQDAGTAPVARPAELLGGGLGEDGNAAREVGEVNLHR